MKHYIKKYIKYILIFLILNSIVVILQFINPILIREMLSLVELNRDFYIYGISILVCILLIYFLRYLSNFIRYQFNKNIKVKESKQLYESMFKVDYSLLKNFDTTYYVSRINDSLNNISNFICNNVTRFIVSIITICISLIISSTFNFVITALFVALFIVNVIFYKRLNLKLQNLCLKMQNLTSTNFKNIINLCKNIDFIKQSFKYNNFSNKVSKYVEKIESENNKVNIYAGKVSIILEGIITIIKILILVFCVFLYLKNEFYLQDIIFIQMILNIYFNALVELKNTNIGLRDLRASILFLNDSVFLKNEINTGTKTLNNIDTLEFNLDNFSYDNSVSNILKNTKFCIKKGDKLALVGKSGVGKSTLLNILLGLYQSSKIYINDIKLNEYSLESLRSKVFVVNQNVSIFPGSLKSNIVIGIENKYNEHLLDKICNEPFMKDLINDVGSIDIDLLDTGGNLSGGQKQKINIARMLMYDPDLIVFDESTSALDSESENKLFECIEKYIEGKTIIKISHRFSSINDMDKVVVLTDLDNGCEIYSSIDDALNNSKTFNKLFYNQIYSTNNA